MKIYYRSFFHANLLRMCQIPSLLPQAINFMSYLKRLNIAFSHFSNFFYKKIMAVNGGNNLNLAQ